MNQVSMGLRYSLKESPQERGRKHDSSIFFHVFHNVIERKSPRKGTKTLANFCCFVALVMKLKESPQERGRKHLFRCCTAIVSREKQLKESPQERGRKPSSSPTMNVATYLNIERKSPRKGTKTRLILLPFPMIYRTLKESPQERGRKQV